MCLLFSFKRSNVSGTRQSISDFITNDVRYCQTAPQCGSHKNRWTIVNWVSSSLRSHWPLNGFYGNYKDQLHRTLGQEICRIFRFLSVQCSNLKSSGGTTALSTTAARWTTSCFITLHLPTAIAVSHWKAENETREEQDCHELRSPSAHLLLIISVKRMIQSHGDPVMWRGWIYSYFTASQVSLGFRCDSQELLKPTIDGHFPLFVRKAWPFPDVS